MLVEVDCVDVGSPVFDRVETVDDVSFDDGVVLVYFEALDESGVVGFLVGEDLGEI